MKPKDKAEELIGSFAPYCTYDNNGLVTPVAKACAIICVDEIIKTWQEDDGAHFSATAKYWQQVKEEIKKL